ncbi:hypothetical protein TNCV_2649351 [Trichonephila clavipes]|nr:hypothetical protein TNCV_2649351 [Trichonephila clavipes]
MQTVSIGGVPKILCHVPLVRHPRTIHLQTSMLLRDSKPSPTAQQSASLTPIPDGRRWEALAFPLPRCSSSKLGWNRSKSCCRLYSLQSYG